MDKYPKIQTIYKRDEKTHKIIIGEYSCPEFELLKDIAWEFTEKVDGTNIRVEWQKDVGVKFGGRTDNAQIHTSLYERLQELFPIEKFNSTITETDHLCLYGEGYGAKVQKGGGNYKSNGVDFVLFDVQVDNWWLMWEDVENVANTLGIKTVPMVGGGNLDYAVELAQQKFQSTWGDFPAEGLVIKPAIDLFNRKGNRIITKIKHKDF